MIILQIQSNTTLSFEANCEPLFISLSLGRKYLIWLEAWRFREYSGWQDLGNEKVARRYEASLTLYLKMYECQNDFSQVSHTTQSQQDALSSQLNKLNSKLAQINIFPIDPKLSWPSSFRRPQNIFSNHSNLSVLIWADT